MDAFAFPRLAFTSSSVLMHAWGGCGYLRGPRLYGICTSTGELAFIGQRADQGVSVLARGWNDYGLFIPQRYHGIDLRRPARGDITGQKSHRNKHEACAAESFGIPCVYLEEHAF